MFYVHFLLIAAYTVGAVFAGFHLRGMVDQYRQDRHERRQNALRTLRERIRRESYVIKIIDESGEYHDSGEGPFPTLQDAVTFADAEVGVEFYVLDTETCVHWESVLTDGGWIVDRRQLPSDF